MKSAVPFTALRKTPLSLAVTQALLLSLGVTGHALAASTGETTLELPTLDVSSEALKAQGGAEDGYKVDTATDIGFLKNRELKDTPYSVQVISKEVIQNQIASSPDDLLTRNASVNIVAPDSSNNMQNMNIRGFPVYSTSGSIAIDGLRTLYLKRIPTSDIENIELLNGLSGFLYGAALPGGFINYQLKKPVYERITNVTVGNYGGSNYFAHADLGGSLNQTDTLAYRLNVMTRNGDTAVEGNNVSETNIDGALEWKITDKVTAEINASHNNNRTDRGTTFWQLASTPTTIDTNKNWSQDWVTDKLESDRIGSKITWDINDTFSVRGAYAYTENRREDIINSVNATVNSGTTTFLVPYLSVTGASHIKENSYYLYLDSKFNTGSLEHTLTTGLSGVDNKWYKSGGTTDVSMARASLWPTLTIFDLPAYTASDVEFLGTHTKMDNVTIGDQIKLNDQWEVLAGATYTSIDTTFKSSATDNAPNNYDESKTTPSLSLVYKPMPWLSTYASYMKGVEAGGGSTSSTPLPPAISEQYEIGAKAELGGSLVTVALFDIDKPYDYLTSSSTYARDGRERHRGIELTTSGKVTNKLTLMGGVTLLDAKVEDTQSGIEGNQPVAVPEVMAKVYGEYAISAVPGLTATAGVYYTGSQYIDTSNNYKLPSYTIGDIGARYELNQFKTPVTLRMNVKNVTDKDYWLSPYYLGSPRTVAFSVETKF
ncbi:TonB-dependent siderophore receptor [Pokkaliibacter plantistimulans]|uniref:TonB-dependent siderophore receptor n=1 Tax=Proteobacteria bacterium 228 TaxID=2083153 RepID=A0A2S5KKB3_9PROT|nr:TonB-dependent siderophore receptor [Pokkaliibacter plantistimulans]PPC75238.1 TonB-dependent siderophore receptor [Pokkaliibacter plantistimulans]